MPPEVRILGAHLFAWAVIQAKYKQMVWRDDPFTQVEWDRLVHWALLASA